VSELTVNSLTPFVRLVGVLAGLVVERFLRSFGRLWCEPSEWKMKFVAEGDPMGGYEEVVPEKAEGVEYSVRLDLFNGKEIPVGLRDITIVFGCEGDEELVHKPWDSTTGMFSLGRTDYAKLVVVNLPPRQWVHLPLHGGFNDQDEARLLAKWRRVEFVGQRQRRGLFEGKTYRKIIATRPVSENRNSRRTPTSILRCYKVAVCVTPLLEPEDG